MIRLPNFLVIPSLILVALSCVRQSQNWSSLTPYEELLREDSTYKYSFNMSKICDTLVLQPYSPCDESFSYAGLQYGTSPTLSCFNHYDISFGAINQFVREHQKEIKVLIIGNPSYGLFDLKGKNFKMLKSIILYGDDFNMDTIKRIPSDFLELKTLESIDIRGVYTPKSEIDMIRSNYPNLDFKISESSIY